MYQSDQAFLWLTMLKVTIEKNGALSTCQVTGNLREPTAMDPVLKRLSFLMLTGLPTDKRKLDPLVRPYLNLKDELSLADGTVYKGQQAVIPKVMRLAMLDKIHKTHFGAGSCNHGH